MKMNAPLPSFPRDEDGDSVICVGNADRSKKLEPAAAFLESQSDEILNHARKLLYVEMCREEDYPFTREGARSLAALSTKSLLESWYSNFRNEDIETKLKQFIDRRITVASREGESVERLKVAKVDKKTEYQDALAVLLKALALVS